ncbi:MAG: GIY-YIG nuclease family protein [Chloroflexi bacterium]|nr:GIY-YIG nuclease family protein [Chloroflexota bacterium]
MSERLDAGQLPREAGTYCVWLRLDAPLCVTVGRLGERTLQSGLYGYVGSALGPGGLRARVGRHLRADTPTRWHIDWLTTHTPIRAVWLRIGRERLECTWSAALRTLPGATIAWPRFGASDCTCAAHLIVVPAAALPAAWDALSPDAMFGTLDGYDR